MENFEVKKTDIKEMTQWLKDDVRNSLNNFKKEVNDFLETKNDGKIEANMQNIKDFLETKKNFTREQLVSNRDMAAVTKAILLVLKSKNLYNGKIDGNLGNTETKNAIAEFQKSQNIDGSVKLSGEGDGVPGPNTIAKVLELLNQEAEPAVEEKPIEYPKIELDKLGEYTGYATVNYKNGTYKGRIEKGEIKGRGTYDFKNGGEYTGEQSNNKIEGRGSYDFKNGGKYTGERENNKFEGRGTYEFNNASKYDGYRKDGKMNGFGTYTNRKGVEFAGTWENNKLDDKTIEDLDKDK